MSGFAQLATTTYADVLDRTQVMDAGVRALWDGGPRLAGPAYPVVCAAGDNLMLHAAIHRAPPGSVIVAQAGDHALALAGGNVCALAQRNGIAGFVVDGVVRDLAEIRALRFPVYARGVVPKPGAKRVAGPVGVPATVGGVLVAADDVVVADEDGIVVVPSARRDDILAAARAKAAKDEAQTLDEWAVAHRATVAAALAEQGQQLEITGVPR